MARKKFVPKGNASKYFVGPQKMTSYPKKRGRPKKGYYNIKK